MEDWHLTEADWTPELAAKVLARDAHDEMDEKTRKKVEKEFWMRFALERLDGKVGHEAITRAYRYVMDEGAYRAWKDRGGRRSTGIVVDGRRVMDLYKFTR